MQYIVFEKKKSGRPSARPELQILSDLHSTMSTHDIAQQYNVADSTVKGWIWRAKKEQQKITTE